MATTYTAKFNIAVWKQHQCVCCDSRFRYLLEREISGTGGSEQAAVDNAQKQAIKQIESGVDARPCPHCGYVQPEMVAAGQRPWYWLGGGVGLVTVIVALILGWSHVLTIGTSATVAMIGVAIALGLGLGLFAARKNPNSNRDRNLAEALPWVEQNRLLLDEAGEGGSELPAAVSHGMTTGHVLAIGLLGAALVATALPSLFATLDGWPKNDGWYPSVLSPGGEARYYFEERISSIKGYWKGNARARFADAESAGVDDPAIRAKTKDSAWGEEMRVKASEKSSKSTVYVDVWFPRIDDLAGKTAKIDLTVEASFPSAMGSSHYQVIGRDVAASSQVAFASMGAQSTYEGSWSMGQMAAVLLMVAGVGMLLWQSKRLAGLGNPTSVYALEDEAAAPAEGDEGVGEGGEAVPPTDPGSA